MASNQIDYLSGRSEKSARDTFFYYSGKDPSAVRYKNWKMYFAMVSDAPAGFTVGVIPYHWTQVVNIKRDPFEISIGSQYKTLMGVGGAIASPSTAYQYDWNMLPIGQALWLKELRDLHSVPAAAKSGELQSGSGHAASERHEGVQSRGRVNAANCLMRNSGRPRNGRPLYIRLLSARGLLTALRRIPSDAGPAPRRHWVIPMPSKFAFLQMVLREFA